MIKLMIVDDEAVIRHGLRQAVDWEQYDITIVAEAKNGKVALEKAVALQPDIVISDIRMPEGNGIDFVKKLLEIFPHVKLIMLSGYSDIEYMMEAIKLGVRDYLLKPAGTAQILQSALKLRDEIYLQREQQQLSVKQENLFNENLDTLKSQFIAELLDGSVPAETLMERAALLQLSFCGPYYATFSAVAKAGREWELVQLLSCLLADYAPTINRPHRSRQIVAVLNVQEQPPTQKLLEVIKQIEPLTDPMILSCITATCALPHELHRLHRIAEQLAARSIWFETRFLHVDSPQVPLPIPNDALLIHERDIVSGIRKADFDAARTAINALFATLHHSQPTMEEFEGIVLGIGHSMCVFSENNAFLTSLEDQLNNPYTVEQIKNAMLSMVNGGYSQYGPQIKNALTFLDQNYMRDVTLADVASTLYISPSYLTRLLKSKTGMGFTEWLHTIRIGKAKKLLENPQLRNYEIAEMVGYKSYKIFSEYFNKIVGHSARKFREMNLKLHS